MKVCVTEAIATSWLPGRPPVPDSPSKIAYLTERLETILPYPMHLLLK
jgi:hypothetical protein